MGTPAEDSVRLTLEQRRQIVAERAHVRPIEDPDLPPVLDLLNSAFGGWGWRDASMSDEAWARYQRDHLHWKLHSPYADDVPSFVLEIESTLAGIIMSIPRRMRVRGDLVPVFGGGNLATAPEWQGAGVGRAIRQPLQGSQQDIARVPRFTVETAPEPVAQERVERSGALSLGNRVRQLFRPLTARAFAAERRRRGRGRLPTPALALAVRAGVLIHRLRWRPLPEPDAVPGAVSQVDRFDRRADELSARAAEEFDFITDWSCKYLNWRFCDPRAGDFTAMTFEADGELLGFIVTKVEGARGSIAQMLALPGRADVAQVLLRAASVQLRDAGVAVIQCALPMVHPYGDLVRRAGFIDSRRDMVFTVGRRNLGYWDTLSFLHDPDARIHVMLGDLDGI